MHDYLYTFDYYLCMTGKEFYTRVTPLANVVYIHRVYVYTHIDKLQLTPGIPRDRGERMLPKYLFSQKATKMGGSERGAP